MADFDDAPKSFEYDSGETVYQQEKPLRAGRAKMASAVTTSVLVLGGLAGGAAFAFTVNGPVAPANANAGYAALTSDAPAGTQDTNVSNPNEATDVVAGSGTTSNSEAGSSGSGSSSNQGGSSQNGTAPAPEATPDPSSSTDPTIAIPPVAFGDKDGERDFHDESSDDGNDDNSSTKSGDSKHKKHYKPTPAPTSTSAPSFGGGDDSEDSGEDD